MSPSDDDIRDMLAARAARASDDGLIDVALAEARWATRSGRPVRRRWRTTIAATAALAGVLVVVAVLVPILSRTGPAPVAAPHTTAIAPPSSVVASPGTSPGPTVWSVDDILDGRIDPMAGDQLLIRGWLVSTPMHPCPSVRADIRMRAPTLGYECGQEDYLTSQRFQPVGRDGVTGPERGLFVASHAYATWAPMPTAAGGGGYEPREGVYLVELSSIGCHSAMSDCWRDAAAAQWFVRGRLDPLPNPT